MRLSPVLTLIGGLLLSAYTVAADDDAASTVAKQKEAAEANYKTLQIAPAGKAETANFLVYGSSTAPRLAASLEKQYSTAYKGLQFANDAKPWTGKLTVYVFSDRGQLRSFARKIEKRSPDDGEQANLKIDGDVPHVAVAPGQGKEAITTDTQAGYQVALALMSARSKGTDLPEWLTQGFARATAAQAAGIPASQRKRVARQLAGRTKPGEAWNDSLSIEDRLPLATSVADYLFYGKGLSRPGDFLMAFRSDDANPMKTAAEAFETMKLTMDKFEAGYLAWLRSNN